jgi:hypothetical protein
MSHLENHPHAFLNEEYIVINILDFQSHDDGLLASVKDYLKAGSYVSCCEYGAAYIGGDFYSNKFYAPKPYDSWVRNEVLGTWEAPIAYPEEDGKQYAWDESVIGWIEIPTE